MAYSELEVKRKLEANMDEFFYFADGIYRLNLDKLANVVSNIEDEAYELGYEHGMDTGWNMNNDSTGGIYI